MNLGFLQRPLVQMLKEFVSGQWITNPWIGDNGTGRVRPINGPQTQTRGRDKAGITTGEKIAEWPTGAKITSIEVACYFTTAPLTADLMATAGNIRGRFAIDPASNAIALALLASLDSISADNGFYTVPISLPGHPVNAIKIDLIGSANSNGDIISNGSLGGGVLYGAANDGTTDLTFEVWGN